MDRARFKLREARHFLTELERELATTLATQPERSRYNFSAFISAADSVFDYGAIDDVAFHPFMTKVWEPKIGPEDREIFHFMTDQRDEEVHFGGAHIEEQQRIDPTAMLRNTLARDSQYSRTPIAAIIADADARGVKVKLEDVYPNAVRTDLVFKGLRPEVASDVLRASARYLELLDGLVSEFESMRATQPQT